ncbi:PaaI family thioesterase [uncultured Roseovarius sp.]|uniref:PaaI family thioesterase n=1 Tax=uncultured Roseovarius sp. TaxID=293344 RepID=UPI002624ACCF|nr:PaaI family thioesterase [uncultured Roseovarius sp.]
MVQKVAQSFEDLADWGDLTARSGFEFMQDMIAGRLAGPPIGTTLGFGPTQVDDGLVIFEGIPEFRATNPMRGLHGGWYGAILDSCMGCAVMTKVPKGSIYTTLEYKVNITRALPLGTKVKAIGTVTHAGRSTSVATGEVRGLDDDRLYATGSTTCMIMPAPAAR